jgi:hypothetical protein
VPDLPVMVRAARTAAQLIRTINANKAQRIDSIIVS